jgi:hypothetical protein
MHRGSAADGFGGPVHQQLLEFAQDKSLLDVPSAVSETAAIIAVSQMRKSRYAVEANDVRELTRTAGRLVTF